MHDLAQLEKQQVGLRLHKYMVDEIDEFTKEYSLNRTDIIIEAIKSYIETQKEKKFYESFEQSCKEARQLMDGELPATTLKDLIDELDADSNS